jgi:hypothetical protein
MSNLYRGPSIDASYQVLVHLAKQFQRRLKCEKLTDDNGQMTDVKWWQKIGCFLSSGSGVVTDLGKCDVTARLQSLFVNCATKAE